MAMPRKPKRPRKVDGAAEYRFKIDAFTPETMPMARLAEYMRELSQMLGEPGAVHFRRLEAGSTILVHKIEHEAIPKVRERVSNVRRGDGPKEALRAYKTINKFLRDDNAVGFLQDKKAGAVIIRFPGREEAEEKFPSVRQHGSIDGIVIRVGGADETVPVWLEAEEKQIAGCYTTRPIAKQLGAKLFEPVRIFGKGRWSRDSEGAWSLVEFKIESFEPLQDASLSDALTELRAIPIEWGDDAYSELGMIRHGPGGKKNGGH
jgi:hypothetical protein